MAWALWLQTGFTGIFQNAVDIVPAFPAVVYQRYVIPGSERMQPVFVIQDPRNLSTLRDAVQEPVVARDPNLQQEPRPRVCAGVGIAFLQIEETLLGRAPGIGPEQDLPRKLLRSRQWMCFDKQRVADSVEQNRLAERCVNHPRMPDDTRRMIAKSVQPVEKP